MLSNSVNKFPEKVPFSFKLAVYKKGDKEYSFQRIGSYALGDYELVNLLGEEPTSLFFDEDFEQDNRIEKIYIAISKGSDEDRKMIGVAEFTYLAVGSVYNAGDIFWALDDISADLGIIGEFLEKYNNKITNFTNDSKVTPYLLFFDGIHGELPENEETGIFIDDNKNINVLLHVTNKIVSDYVFYLRKACSFLSHFFCVFDTFLHI